MNIQNPVLGIAQNMRMESAINYLHSALEAKQIYSQSNLFERLRPLHSEDFERLEDIVNNRQEQIVADFEQERINLYTRKKIEQKQCITAVAQTSVQGVALHLLLNKLALSPEYIAAKVAFQTIAALLGHLYNYEINYFAKEGELIDHWHKIETLKVINLGKIMKGDIKQFYGQRLEGVITDLQDSARRVDRQVARFTKDNRIMRRQFQLMTRVMSGSAVEQPMVQLLPPPPPSTTDESFLHVSEPDSSEGASNELDYLANATPSDIAADFYMELAQS